MFIERCAKTRHCCGGHLLKKMPERHRGVAGASEDVTHERRCVLFPDPRWAIRICTSIFLASENPFAVPVVHDSHHGRVNPCSIALQILCDLEHGNRVVPSPQTVHNQLFQRS